VENSLRAVHQRASTTASGSDDRSTSPSGSDRGRTCSTRQQLRLFTMDSVDVDHHPCASKQVHVDCEIRAPRAGMGQGKATLQKQSSCGERFEVGFEGGPHPDGER
jgi:hypothetical protein